MGEGRKAVMCGRTVEVFNRDEVVDMPFKVRLNELPTGDAWKKLTVGGVYTPVRLIREPDFSTLIDRLYYAFEGYPGLYVPKETCTPLITNEPMKSYTAVEIEESRQSREKRIVTCLVDMATLQEKMARTLLKLADLINEDKTDGQHNSEVNTAVVQPGSEES